MLVTRETAGYDLAQLVADIGGQLGIWIGLSFVAIVELLELAWRVANRALVVHCSSGVNTAYSSSSSSSSSKHIEVVEVLLLLLLLQSDDQRSVVIVVVVVVVLVVVVVMVVLLLLLLLLLQQSAGRQITSQASSPLSSLSATCSRTRLNYHRRGVLICLAFIVHHHHCHRLDRHSRAVIISGTERNGGTHCDWPVDGIGHR